MDRRTGLQGAKRKWACAMAVGIALFSFHQAGWSEVTPAVAGADAPVIDKAEADGIIFERQQVMLRLDKDAKTLGMIAAGSAPASKLAETTRSIAEAARDSVAAFETVAPGGRSKPEVWSNHPDYMRALRDFAVKAEAMAKAGQGGDVNAVTGLMIDAMPCKQCHDRYRAPKTS
ncbi:cytochrome c [Sphingobium sufflavum]|uniref:cytochrome c n=1 Tax=Sphingobium sufflavum TaxID=1129547 RepID=UPI001F26AB1D|nr:cytochrome c [Sphingobium sufflavum]MCE7798280.1 cytochrome c [Sphingobium sufflavum]